MGKNLFLKHFRLDAPVSWSLLRLTYTCDFTPNRLKSSGIGKWKKSENFVKLALTVWEIWPAKRQGGRSAPPPAPIRVNLNLCKMNYFIETVLSQLAMDDLNGVYMYIYRPNRNSDTYKIMAANIYRTGLMQKIFSSGGISFRDSCKILLYTLE